MQDEVFPINLVLKYKFVYEALNQTAPNWITLNQTMWSQTKACIAKSCEVCALVRHYEA